MKRSVTGGEDRDAAHKGKVLILRWLGARQRLYLERRIRRDSASMKRTAKKSFNRYYCKSGKGFKTLNNLFD